MNGQIVMYLVGALALYGGSYLAWQSNQHISSEEHRASNSLSMVESYAARSNPAFGGLGIGISIALLGVVICVAAALHMSWDQVFTLLGAFFSN